MISPNINNIRHVTVIDKALTAEATVNKSIKSNIPTVIVGKDFSRVITIIFLLVIIEFTRATSDKVNFNLQKDEYDDEVKRVRKTYDSPGQNTTLPDPETKLEKINDLPEKKEPNL